MAASKRTRGGRTAGFGGVRKLPSGRLQARYIGPDTKRYTAPHTFASKTEALGWLASERRLIDLDAWTPPADRLQRQRALNVTVAELAEKWISDAGHLTPGSRATYESIVKTRIHPYLDSVALADFDRAAARTWVNDMRDDYPETVSRNSQAYTLLHSVFAAAVEDELVETNPVDVKGGGRKPQPEIKDVLTAEQLAGLIQHAPDVYGAALAIAAWCGLRFSEWSELRRSDVTDTGSGVSIRVTRGATRVARETHIGTPKAGSTRTVVVPPHLVPVLRDHVKTHVGTDADAFLFPNTHGTRSQPSTFRNHFYRWAKKAGCSGHSPHALRHFGGTMYAVSGATTREIMQYLGHQTVGASMHYQHVAQGRADQLASRLSALAGTKPIGGDQ